jgi:diguanylate cyclase (GGDEF)-like protein
MNSLFLRSGLVALLIAVVTCTSVHIALPLFGEEPMPSAIWLSTILSFVIAFPIAAFFFNKNAEIVRLNAKLTKAYRELSVMHQQLEESSSWDGMTGVLNREAFFKRVGELHNQHCQGALLLIDADHFKSINDQFGHAAGDEALVAIAQAIKAQVRNQDIVGRLGGEEFGVFLRNATDAEADITSERIRAAVQAIEFRPNADCRHPLSVSIGGTGAAQGRALQTVMALADKLLYVAKSQGRNRVVMEAA